MIYLLIGKYKYKYNIIEIRLKINIRKHASFKLCNVIIITKLELSTKSVTFPWKL